MKEQNGGMTELEMKLDAMIALAVASERVELLPSDERISRHLQGDENSTPNERALMKNLEGWIKVAVEAARALIETKQKLQKASNEADALNARLEVIGSAVSEISKAATVVAVTADGNWDDERVDQEGELRGIW